VKLETIAQDLKADARVQIAGDMQVTEDKVDLGKAVIHLADAFARGDNKALKPMLTRRAQSLLDDLTASGGWEEATKPIEAVRIVFMQDGVELGGVGTAAESSGEAAARVSAKVMELMKGLPPEQMAAIQKAMTGMMAGMDPAQLAKDPAKLAELQTKLSEAAKAAGISEELIGKLGELGTEVTASAPTADAGASASTTGTGILLAIQDSKGAYVLGWAAEKAGDTWVFTNAPATGEIRPRASLWDNVGAEGFQAVRIAAAPTAGSTLDGSPGNRGGGDVPSIPSGGGEGPSSSPPSGPAPGTPAPPPRAPGSPGRPPGSGG
jgi:hypothetical protein